MNQSTPPANSPLFYHDLITAYTTAPHFVERHWLWQQIQSALDQPHCRFLLLTAEPGAGKSAMLAWLAQQHPDWLRYFIRRDSQTPLSSGDARAWLFAVGHQLAALHPELFRPDQLEVVVNQRIHEITASGRVSGIRIEDLYVSPFYKTALKVDQQVGLVAGELEGLSITRLVAEQRFLDPANLEFLALYDPATLLLQRDPAARIVLLVDALDELRYQAGGVTLLDRLAAWTPLPANVRVILTARPDEALLALFRQRQKGWLVEQSIDPKDSQVQEDVQRYIRQFVVQPSITTALQNESILPDTFVEEAVKRSEGNFQYASALTRGIEAALTAGQQTDLSRLLRFDAVLPGLAELYAFFLRLIKASADSELVEMIDDNTSETRQQPAWEWLYQPILGTLAVTQEPLAAAQLMSFAQLSVEDRWFTSALTRLAQFLDSSADRYRLYHSTFPEFLTGAQTRTAYRDCYLNAGEWHRKIAAVGLATCGKRWVACQDEYTLRYTPTHLTGAAQASTLPSQRRLQAQTLYGLLVQNQHYATAYLARFQQPDRLLADLQAAVTVALEDNNLAEVYRYHQRYLELLQQERGIQKFVDDIKQAAYQRAMERTSLLSHIPSSQALLRLWIIWQAAQMSQVDFVNEAIQLTLRSLSKLPSSPALAQANPRHDELSNTLGRFLVRIAQALTPNLTDQPAWLLTVLADQNRLDPQSVLAEWGRSFAARRTDFSELDQPAALVLLQIEEEFQHSGYSFGEDSMRIREPLARLLAYSVEEEEWQAYVQRAIALITFDDYPSYREMGLIWLANSILTHPVPEQAQTALQQILQVLIETPEPVWPEDTAAMALSLYTAEPTPTITAPILQAMVYEQLQTRQPIKTISHVRSVQSRGRHDPWAWEVRRLNAVAAVLDHHNFLSEAKQLLQQASDQPYTWSFAGYHCLASLALALRWLEWGDSQRTQTQLDGAANAASRMEDNIIGRERWGVVEQLRQWCQDPPAPPPVNPAHDLAQQVNQQRGLLRSYAIQYLAARYADDEASLKALLPVALGDVVAFDAVLGRLLHRLGVQGELSREAVEALLRAM